MSSKIARPEATAPLAGVTPAAAKTRTTQSLRGLGAKRAPGTKSAAARALLAKPETTSRKDHAQRAFDFTQGLIPEVLSRPALHEVHPVSQQAFGAYLHLSQLRVAAFAIANEYGLVPFHEDFAARARQHGTDDGSFPLYDRFKETPEALLAKLTPEAIAELRRAAQSPQLAPSTREHLQGVVARWDQRETDPGFLSLRDHLVSKAAADAEPLGAYFQKIQR